VVDVEFRHEDEMRAAVTSSKTELSRVTKELEVTKTTLAQYKMSVESLNSQVNTVYILTYIDTHMHTVLVVIFSGKPGLASFSLH